MTEAINLEEKLNLFMSTRGRRTVAQIDDQDVRIVEVKASWHKHDDTNPSSSSEKGHLTIQRRDRDIQLDEEAVRGA